MELDKTNIFRYLTCVHEADVQLVPTSICILLEDRWDAISPIFGRKLCSTRIKVGNFQVPAWNSGLISDRGSGANPISNSAIQRELLHSALTGGIGSDTISIDHRHIHSGQWRITLSDPQTRPVYWSWFLTNMMALFVYESTNCSSVFLGSSISARSTNSSGQSWLPALARTSLWSVFWFYSIHTGEIGEMCDGADHFGPSKRSAPAEISAVASHGQLPATLSHAGLELARWRYYCPRSIRLVVTAANRWSPQIGGHRKLVVITANWWSPQIGGRRNDPQV